MIGDGTDKALLLKKSCKSVNRPGDSWKVKKGVKVLGKMWHSKILVLLQIYVCMDKITCGTIKRVNIRLEYISLLNYDILSK